MKIKLVALDMDGTTYYSAGDIVPSNLKPIKQLMHQGVEVVFVTGRPIFARWNRFEHHGLVSPTTIVAGYNGAVIYHLKDKKVLYKAPISNAQAHQIFKLTKELGPKGALAFGYVDDFKNVVMNLERPEIRDPNNLHDVEMEFFDGKYHTYHPEMKYDYFKFLVFGGNKRLFDHLKKLGFSVATSDNFNAEINAPGVHKGTAVKWIGDYYKIKPEEMMAIGDGANDIPMMPYVTHSVSLANSVKGVKEIARHKIKLTNEEGGVGYAIKHLILEEGINK